MTARLGAAVATLYLCTACGAADQQLVDRGVGLQGSPTAVDVEDVPVRGADVDVKIIQGSNISGELLAADATSVTILDGAGRVERADARNVDEVVVELYASGGGGTALWTVVGSLSTVSHGFFLIFTLPIWVITGAATSGVASAQSRLHVPRNEIPLLYQFARFPQGLPPGFGAGARPRYATSWLSNDDSDLTR